MRIAAVCLALALASAIACDDGDDSDEPASCDGCACEDYCVELCQRVDTECGAISVRDCTRGCFEFEPSPCPPSTIGPRSCDDLGFEGSCYEALGSDDGHCESSSRVPPGLCFGGEDAYLSRCGRDQRCNETTMVCEPP